ncbi:MAG TPA: LysR family transcriptional regulator [Ramlibacter sp.]|nr:LysR family transcriptional regulator [Ramlibacter sp.]
MIRSHFSLLVCLDALLTERSVTRAAQKLDMSQPGMSNALARLRQLTGDPLLIRTPQGFRLTERAEALAEKVRASLALMDEIFANEAPLDPLQAAGTVTIAAPDSVGIAIIPALVEALASAAPQVQLDIRLPDPERLRDWLVEGECDLALGHFPDLPSDLRCSSLFTQSLACIRSSANAPAQPLTLEDYLEATHVVFGSPFSPRSTMETTIDEALGAGGHARRRMVRVSSLPPIAYIVARGGLMATLPEWMAVHHATFLPLDVQPLPFELPPVECRMVWHDRTHRLGLQGFVREQVRRVVRELVDGEPAGSLLRTGVSAST